MRVRYNRWRAGLVAGAVALVGVGLTPAGPAAAAGETFVITGGGASWQAAAPSKTFNGTLKGVVQDAEDHLSGSGGGTISFPAGTYDLGSDYFKLENVRGVTFQGAGRDLTIIKNVNNSASDTEPFNFSGAFNVTVKDLAVSAGGVARNTSDAMDFDNGNNSLVQNVRITDSRGRGIIFDGKNEGWSSTGNRVSNCLISGTASHGIQFLASSGNVVEGCRIENVGGSGIHASMSSDTAAQPNKESSNNTIRNNQIENAGEHGISTSGGDNNRIVDNMITNSSSGVANKDGIHLGSARLVNCDDNVVSGNTARDTRAVAVQRYGLFINSLCRRTVVYDSNVFTGNRLAGNRGGGISDNGVNTIYRGGDPGSAVPVAVFDYTPTSGAYPLSVQFTDRSTNSPTSWAWKFGDGTSSSEENPKHTYNNPGTYTVELVATNGNGASAPKTATVTVNHPAPEADFSADKQSGVAPVKIKFTDSSTGGPTKWSWDFGDGTTSSKKSPTHVFKKIGKLTVTLTVSNPTGDSTKKMKVRVYKTGTPAARMVKPTKSFVNGRKVVASWRSTPAGPRASSYEVTRQVAAPNSRFGERTTWLETSSTKGSFRGRAGFTYCMRVRGVDADGNTGRWSRAKCTTVPLDDRRLDHTQGWRERTQKGAYFGTVLRTQRHRATIFYDTNAKHIAVLATTCNGCGSLRIWLDNEFLKKISLNSATTKNRQLLNVADFDKMRAGKIRIVVASKLSPLVFDGLGVSRR